MRSTIVVVSALALVTGCALTLAGCSSSSSSGPTADGGEDAGDAEAGGGGGVDATIDVVNNPTDCVKPGTANNSQGVGGYCNAGGGQCAHAGPGGSPTLCSADFNGVANAWFCTVACNPTSDCGPGAACIDTNGGPYCVPTGCGATLADAGDLPGEGGATDASHDGSPTEGGAAEASAGDGATTDGPTAD